MQQIGASHIYVAAAVQHAFHPVDGIAEYSHIQEVTTQKVCSALRTPPTGV
jgi:hypothetical protein